MIAVQAHFHQNKITEQQFIKIIKQKDLCVGFVSELKVSPLYFNKEGKILSHMFIDTKTLKVNVIAKIDGRKVVENTKENELKWA